MQKKRSRNAYKASSDRGKSGNRQEPFLQKSGGQIRIIGGDWRGRKLPVLDSEGLRPTSDRVRETLFNWLQFDIAGARCLDLFAGTGALGLEALSRGAAEVVFVEYSSKVADQLRLNLETLNADSRAKVFQADALTWLENGSSEVFDMIFLDPPFHKGLLPEVLEKLFTNGYIDASTFLYIEQEKAESWPELPENWQVVREKRTSQVVYGLFKKDI